MMMLPLLSAYYAPDAFLEPSHIILTTPCSEHHFPHVMNENNIKEKVEETHPTSESDRE